MNVSRALVGGILHENFIVHVIPLAVAILETAEGVTLKLAVVRCGCHAYSPVVNLENTKLEKTNTLKATQIK